jgi:hypothetical protein
MFIILFLGISATVMAIFAGVFAVMGVFLAIVHIVIWKAIPWLAIVGAVVGLIITIIASLSKPEEC